MTCDNPRTVELTFWRALDLAHLFAAESDPSPTWGALSDTTLPEGVVLTVTRPADAVAALERRARWHEQAPREAGGCGAPGARSLRALAATIVGEAGAGPDLSRELDEWTDGVRRARAALGMED